MAKLLFSERLKKLRRDMALGQTAFAKLMHISRNYVSMLEGGREPGAILNAHFDRLERLFYGVSEHERADAVKKLVELAGQESDFIFLPGERADELKNAVDAVAHLPPGEERQKQFESHLPAKATTEDATPYVTGPRSWLKLGREAKGYSKKEMAKKLGYSDLGTYQAIEDGRSQMGEKMIRKAAEILGLDVSDLMSSEHPIDRDPSKGTFGAIPDIRLPPGMTAKFVPLISLAQCGPNMTWTDDAYAGEGVLAINCKDPKAFAVTLAGDSMCPKYDPGDTAIIYPSSQPRNGDVVLARLDDEHGGDVMIKLYQSSGDGDTVTLSSYNPVYQPTTWPRSAFAILHPVAQITKNLR